MWRLLFIMVGFALLVGAHVLIWWVSGQAEATLGADTAAAPRDVALAYKLMVGFGFVFMVGGILEGAYNTWTSLLTSGHNVSRDVAVYQREEGVGLVRRAFWGVPPYTVIALIFGLCVRLGIEHQQFGPWLFTDPGFIGFAFSWPYHFLAAAGLWGFTVDKFY